LKHEGVLRPGCITKAHWLDKDTVLMTVTDGTVQLRDFREKSCKVLTRFDSKPWQFDLAGQNQIVVGLDAGEARRFDMREASKQEVISKKRDQACLTVQASSSLFALGFSHGIEVLDLA